MKHLENKAIVIRCHQGICTSPYTGTRTGSPVRKSCEIQENAGDVVTVVTPRTASRCASWLVAVDGTPDCYKPVAVPVCIGRRCSGLGASAVTGELVLEVVRVVRREPGEPLWDRLRRHLEVDAATGCWLWRGRRDRDGYGTLSVNDRTTRTHRAVWEALVAPVPPGLHVLHRCDTRSCCRPACLKLGTNADNVRDRMDRGRGGRRPTRPRLTCTECSTPLGRNAWNKGTRRCHRCAAVGMWAGVTDDKRRKMTDAWWRSGVAARRQGAPRTIAVAPSALVDGERDLGGASSQGAWPHTETPLLQCGTPSTPPGVVQVTRRNVGLFIATEGRCSNVRAPHRQRIYCRETTLALRLPPLSIGATRCS